MARSWPPKDPNDVLDYQVDWSRRLDDGDTIDTADFSFVTAAGLSKQSQTWTDTTATVWLTGGTAGQTAQVLCRIVTVEGRQFDKTIPLAISER